MKQVCSEIRYMLVEDHLKSNSEYVFNEAVRNFNENHMYKDADVPVRMAEHLNAKTGKGHYKFAKVKIDIEVEE